MDVDSVEDLIIPSIEESICKTSVRNYELVEERYYEQFFWCPALKKPKQKTGDGQEELEEKEDIFLSQIKSIIFLGLSSILFV
jgi:hypothetical protein